MVRFDQCHFCGCEMEYRSGEYGWPCAVTEQGGWHRPSPRAVRGCRECYEIQTGARPIARMPMDHEETGDRVPHHNG